MIYDVIYSLFVLTEKLTFFNKQLERFIISLMPIKNLQIVILLYEPFTPELL